MGGLRVLVIPDKFKGTLSAFEAAGAIAAGWRRARPADRLELLPMSDGGDGFGAVMGRLTGAVARRVRTVNAAHEPCTAKWWWEPRSKTALIESAAVIGLAMLPPGKFHPFELDTLGLAGVIEAAAGQGAARCIVGIGGSATNDGGFGLARGLGWKFLDAAGRSLERWTELERLAAVQAPRRTRWFKELRVAVDVQNPLLGPRGASRVYGPQKGLRPEDFPRADRCLARLAAITRRRLKGNFAKRPGAGAAGGLGFGLPAFLGAKLTPGFGLFATVARLDARLRGADLVLTGEGSIDRSTLMGKGVSEIARRCRKLGRPCIGLGGVVEPEPRLLRLFSEVHALVELTSVENAKRRPQVWLEALAEAVAASMVPEDLWKPRAQRASGKWRRGR